MSQIRLAYQELFEGKPIERSSYADFMHIFDENDDDTLAPANQKRTFVGRQKCVFCWQGQEDRSNKLGFAKLRPTVLEWL